ncbi:MAG TPA: response regulator transcription factor [Bryobacteraceae bacterium]|nr:response regulator transcription factor [Bryobacteraceae bacterium]
MKKILLIEDDTDLFALLQYNLEKEGFLLTGLQTGRGAIELCRKVRPDLILLDIMLPDSDGLDICKGIRNDADLASIPIIFLTARASETDRIIGLEVGANDYVVKPFSIRELIARVKLQFRSQAQPARVLEAGGIELDRTSCQVRVNGAPLALTATEFRLLEFLMSRPGAVFSREQLLNAVWGQDRAITDRAVDVYVLRLRQKVEKDPANPLLIHSIRGFGYTFEPSRERATMA